MKLKLLFPLLLFTTLTFAQSWQYVGQPDFSNTAVSARLAFSPNGTPYIVYQDADFANRTRVEYFDGTFWQDLGTPSTSAADSESIAFNPADNSVWVAHALTSSRQVFLYRYNGSSWANRLLQFGTSQFRYGEHLGLHYTPSGLGGLPSMTYFLYPQTSASGGSQQNVSQSSNAISINGGAPITSSGIGVLGRNNSVAVDKYGNLLTNRTNDDVFTSNFWLNTTTSNSNTTGFTGKTISYQTKHYDVIKNRWIAHTRDSGATADELQFYIGTNLAANQPTGSPNAQGELVSIDMDSNNKTYVLYAKTNNQPALEIYNNGNWTTDAILPIVPTITPGYLQQIAVNEATDEVYFMFMGLTGKLNVMKFVPPPLTRIYVDANVSGGNGSGDSWANATTDLDTALGLIQPGITNEIWVAQGTYRTDANVVNGFTIATNDISIYGGFDGTESQLSERDVRTNETIFSGDASNNDTGVGFNTSSRSENADHVFRITGNNITLDGLTISDGHANNASTEIHRNAGAIYINPDVTDFGLYNCTLKNNVAHNGGGAIRWWTDQSNADIFIQNNIFENNLARWGASIYLLTDNSASYLARIINNLFNNNTTADNGSNKGLSGDIWLRSVGNNSTATTTIVNNTFANFNSLGTNTFLNQPTAIGLSRKSTSTTSAGIYNTITYGHNDGSGGTLNGVGRVSSNNNLVAQVFVNNSIASDNFATATGATNTLSTDPLFVDANTNDYRLGAGSPAIDTGNNSWLTVSGINVPIDLDFNTRIKNSIVDMGAYEFDASLGLENNNTLQAFNLFPNPTKEHLLITTNETINKIEVFNYLGQEVLKTTQTKINTSNLTDGMYLVKVSTTTGKIGIKRFIKN